jgi:hypothetical protein
MKRHHFGFPSHRRQEVHYGGNARLALYATLVATTMQGSGKCMLERIRMLAREEGEKNANLLALLFL